MKDKPQLPAEMEKRLENWWMDNDPLDFGQLSAFLATALEEQRKEVLSEVDEAVTKRVLPAPLYGNYKEDELHQRWQVELNQLKDQ